MKLFKVVLLTTVVFIISCASSGPRVTPSYYFKDTIDGGNKALTAGCHIEYLTSNDCATGNTRRIVSRKGDSCPDSRESVTEYTNQECHQHNPATDIVSRNCDTACGSKSGRCVDETITCAGAQVTSAKCECFVPDK